MQKIHRWLLIVLAQWAVYGLLILWLGFNSRFAAAHDAKPAPPNVPACLPAATMCELPAAGLLRASIRPFAPGNVGAPDALLDQLLLDDPTPLYNVACVNGFADMYPCHNVDLLAFLPHSLLGGYNGNDIWGWTDPLTGKEYALVGSRNGLGFVDISDPVAPRYVGRLPTQAATSAWRGVKVYQNYALVVADKNFKHGMQVFDLTQLRAVASSPMTFTATAHYAGFNDAHNIAINEATGYAYATGSETCNAGGLHMIDVRDPLRPQNAGCYNEDGYIHDTQCVLYHGPDADYQNREICFNSSLIQISIVDVTDKSAPRRVGSVRPPGTIYIHQGWLTQDQRYFLMDDEFDETFNQHGTRTYIIDMADLDNPVALGVYSTTLPSIDHNLFISGTYAYEANYTTGLRVLDIQDVAGARLQEAAWFDTYPGNDEPVFTGAWGSYPFFASGVVVVNTIDRGLFILKPTLPADFLLETAQTTLALCRT
ncbi:MAG: choice-of-anchor B family protein, partial [Chloroflexota bacterium]|nr:choice-of-anchor B family protein [Chloroflexota bacterium]